MSDPVEVLDADLESGDEVEAEKSEIDLEELEHKAQKRQLNYALGATMAIIISFMILSAIWGESLTRDAGGASEENHGGKHVPLDWHPPVMLNRAPECVDETNGQDIPEGAIGYEPSIAVDNNGHLYYTAHKDLRWAGPGGSGVTSVLGDPNSPFPPLPCVDGYDTTWDYYASWFFVSRDGGTTWHAPSDWGVGEAGNMVFPGDEGDIGVDANDRVYFIDTTLEDNWLHVWDDGGRDYVRGQRQSSLALDDRPWITAQGDGYVHYLGNSGVAIPGPNGDSGRYWYYRSTNGGLTWIEEKELPGGWAHIDAEREGDHVYIAQEVNNGGSGGVKVWVSDDRGESWADPIIVGPLEGTHPEGYPWVSAGENGTVAVTWQESPQGGRAVGTVHIAMSWDYGVNWTNWTITPFDAVFLYPNVYVGKDNHVGIAFYANEGNHSVGDEWHLYGGMLKDPREGDQWHFSVADPVALYTSSESDVAEDDLHPLHDLFEISVSPVDHSLNIAYQHNIGEHPFEDGEEQRYLYFVKGVPKNDESDGGVII